MQYPIQLPVPRLIRARLSPILLALPLAASSTWMGIVLGRLSGVQYFVWGQHRHLIKDVQWRELAATPPTPLQVHPAPPAQLDAFQASQYSSSRRLDVDASGEPRLPHHSIG